MEIFRPLVVTALFLGLFVPGFYASSNLSIETVINSEENKIEKQAEELYKKIKSFLSECEDISPENFDKFCAEWMIKNLNYIKILDKKNFDNESKYSTILYRGVDNKKFANEFKSGKIYFPLNFENVRGTGIYTTTCLECAKSFSDTTDFGTIIKMLMPKTEVKILENEYLEKLKEIICNNHKEEFGEFVSKDRYDYIYDSLKDYLDEAFKKEINKKYDEMLNHLSDKDNSAQEEDFLNEVIAKVEKDPEYQKLKPSRKIFFKTNKAALFYNSGLLTTLLGFDVLHTIDYLRDFVNFKEEEYLIVNPQILSILKD